jgi:hypothetical protein
MPLEVLRLTPILPRPISTPPQRLRLLAPDRSKSIRRFRFSSTGARALWSRIELAGARHSFAGAASQSSWRFVEICRSSERMTACELPVPTRRLALHARCHTPPSNPPSRRKRPPLASRPEAVNPNLRLRAEKRLESPLLNVPSTNGDRQRNAS